MSILEFHRIGSDEQKLAFVKENFTHIATELERGVLKKYYLSGELVAMSCYCLKRQKLIGVTPMDLDFYLDHYISPEGLING